MKSSTFGTYNKDSAELVTSGVYQISRNPIYSSYILTHFGIVLLNPTCVNMILATANVGVMKLLVNKEESILRERYGASYERYFQSTGRWISGPSSFGNFIKKIILRR